MRRALLLFLGLALAVPLIVGADEGEKAETFKLSFKPLKKWDIWTPNNAPVALESEVGARLPLPSVGGGKIVVEVKKDGVWGDTNGDGIVDTKAQAGFITFPLEYADGTKGAYQILFQNRKGGWQWSRHCVMTGKVLGERFTLIDQNHNGIYGEPGKDTVMIGKEDCASYVSSVMNIKDKLYDVSISPGGQTVSLTPHEGPTGVLDLTSRYALKAKDSKSRLRLAMVKKGEDVFFNLAGKPKDFQIPVGSYEFVTGLVGSGMMQMADIEKGKMEKFEVTEGEVTTHAWGAPGLIEFEAQKDEEEGNITIDSGTIRLYGQGGEKYMRFQPTNFTPYVQVREVRKDKIVINKSMGGGC